ncbi:hypothetical protein QR680_006658 [Steinernema hermaphroditum]|uniref:Uncharacterized protein n=1 Tax=Steinernema hermaphroditum TaxID=289476 RepID=A0AA39LXS5_9BILA|nr:hypothetical protein QR680_006658 [Steinernema hermaphroditum]
MFAYHLPPYYLHPPDYTNDFAYLSPDIIADVLDLFKLSLPVESPNIFLLPGIWGRLARRFRTTTSLFYASDPNGVHVLIMQSFFNEIGEFIKHVPLQEASNFPICLSIFQDDINFFEYKNYSFEFFNSICLQCHDIPSDFLKQLSTRFSTLSLRYDAPSEAKSDFLKRQLRSRHLRQLIISGTGVQLTQIEDLLRSFVRKPNFELLDIWECCVLSFKFYLDAVQAWGQMRFFETAVRRIHGLVPIADLLPLELPFPLVSRHIENHPIIHDYWCNVVLRRPFSSGATPHYVLKMSLFHVNFAIFE